MDDWLDRVVEESAKEGADEQAKAETAALYGMGMGLEDIARAVDRPLSFVRQWHGAEISYQPPKRLRREIRNMVDWLNCVKQKNRAEGADEQAERTAANLSDMGLKPEDIAKVVHRSLTVVLLWLAVKHENTEELGDILDWLDKVKLKSLEQGEVQGENRHARKTTINLYGMGMKPEDIAKAVDRSLSVVQQWLAAGTA